MDADELRRTGDVALVVAVGRWHQDALAELYRRHGGTVYALTRRLLADRERAEEVVQDVFVGLWRAPERFDPSRGTLRSFLLAVAHGRAVDLLRSDTARRGREDREARLAAGAGYDLEREVADIVAGEHVREALATLSAGERRAIELAYFGGHTYREVATVLDEPEGTVKSRIRVGLGRLREALVTTGAVER